VTKDKPFANLYYTVELPGVMRYISLTSYAPGQTFDTSEEQYVWLDQLLQKVTPCGKEDRALHIPAQSTAYT
jgi:hypothetical protein